VNSIPPVNNTNLIRYADLFRLTTPTGTYLFATTPAPITIPSISATPFSALGQLVRANGAQRDIKSTANETSVTLIGIDTTMLGIVLSSKIKGSQIELWHAFFDENNQLLNIVDWTNSTPAIVNWTNTSGTIIGWQSTTPSVYKYFNGYVNTFSIDEQWMDEARAYVGTVTISASSFQLVLQNRTAGRYTNDNSWQSFNAGDTSMNRVAFVSTINYFFGRTSITTAINQANQARR